MRALMCVFKHAAKKFLLYSGYLYIRQHATTPDLFAYFD